jgi:hypothetical protein
MLGVFLATGTEYIDVLSVLQVDLFASKSPNRHTEYVEMDSL